MAYLGDFDATTVEPADFSALPAGDYPVIITNSEFRTTKNGSGQYLALTFQVIDGPAKGRYVWHNLNIQNANSKAEEIAQRELSAICRATGMLRIKDSETLHGIPHLIHVAYIPAKGEFAEKNQIKKWMRLGETQATSAPQAAVPPPARQARATPTPSPAAPPRPAAKPEGKIPPWKKPAAPAPAPALEPAGDFDDDITF
jgi:hypothetical protein